jgi:hypothetical protein
MRFAAILVVGWHLWKRWRSAEVREDAQLAVNPMQLLVVSLFATATLVIAIPVAAWLGFVLVVYAPQLGL